MLRYDVLQHEKGCSIWIELSSFDELPLEQRQKPKPTMAQAMARSSMLEIGGINPRLISYADLLRVFPDLDPETTYITTHFKLDRPYKWPPLKG